MVKKADKMRVEDAVGKLIRRDVVRINEGEVEVRVCKVKDIPVFVQFIGLLFDELGIKLTDAGQVEELTKAKLEDTGFLLKLISKYSETVFTTIARFTNLDEDTFRELDIDEAVAVTKKVVEVNYDFFMSAVIPQIRSVAIAKMTGSPEKT